MSLCSRLQAVRPSVLPNEGFLAQLRLYEVLMELNKMDSIVSRWYHLQQTANLHCRITCLSSTLLQNQRNTIPL